MGLGGHLYRGGTGGGGGRGGWCNHPIGGTSPSMGNVAQPLLGKASGARG